MWVMGFTIGTKIKYGLPGRSCVCTIIVLNTCKNPCQTPDGSKNRSPKLDDDHLHISGFQKATVYCWETDTIKEHGSVALKLCSDGVWRGAGEVREGGPAAGFPQLSCMLRSEYRACLMC